MNLITRERAQRNVNQSTFTAAELATLDAFIASVSSAVRRYCRREFAAARRLAPYLRPPASP